jgi:mannose-6-phosphate isomerase-like protein (cupin superfamily)
MYRLSFLADEPWDEVNDDDRMRVRWFGHPFGADVLGASLRELLPGSPGGWLHMHYGVEEMFFVLAGTPTVRTPEGEEQLSPGDVVYFPEGPEGLHNFSNPTDEPSPQSDFPMLSLIPSRASHGWRLAIPNVRCLKAATPESSLALSSPRVSSDMNIG